MVAELKTVLSEEFLFRDVQTVKETMLEDLNGILNSGDVPIEGHTRHHFSIFTARSEFVIMKQAAGVSVSCCLDSRSFQYELDGSAPETKASAE